MVKVGLIGLGFMGQTHFRCYEKLGAAAAKVVAIADLDERRTRGDLTGTWGNIEGAAAKSIPMTGITGTTDYHRVLTMPEVDMVDICVPTPVHAEVCEAAIAAGKHVLCEKPFVRTIADAERIVGALAKGKSFFMPALCIRFWPAYVWLKEAVTSQRYGAVRAATFRRVASEPPRWYRDGAASGGAILDLHIHDTDFVAHLLGMPKAVFSRGYTKFSGEIDHVMTHYLYDNIPLVTAEGGWAMSDGFGFNMAYTVNFERATADLDFSRLADRQLLLNEGGKQQPVQVSQSDGWFEEISYFVRCVAERRAPTVATAEAALKSLRLIEAENQSIRSGKAVAVEAG